MFTSTHAQPYVARRAFSLYAALVMIVSAVWSAGAQAPLGSSAFPADSARSRKASATSSQRSIVDTVTATLSKLEMHETTIPAGGAPHDPHRHPDEEMIVVRAGVIEALLGTEKRTVGPGGVVFFASNQLHGLKNLARSPRRTW
jgi:quercetin dioxygenase-like cupin family protein